ncbi:MAG: MgtC/SapB family protein [Anaerolineae bacterium]|nr:MgtC/SapB family protein [Anaerolineae bacterium]
MNSASFLLRLAVAAVAGGLVGLEREAAGQPAGLRTHALVSLGAALFTAVGLLYPQGDQLRTVAALATGIGFLGAGAIVRSGATVQGLTTAASLWSTAAVGLAAGSGFYVLAGGSVLLILLVLRGLAWLKAVPTSARPTRASRPASTGTEVAWGLAAEGRFSATGGVDESRGDHDDRPGDRLARDRHHRSGAPDA